MNSKPKIKRGESGASLIVATCSLVFLIPMVGLAVDTGFLYSAKARLQMAVDGSSLAAARALNLGATLQSQQASAAQNAVNWFWANFPSGAYATTGTVMNTTGATNSATGFSSTSVNIFPDANNPQLDHVNVTATTQVPTWFMHWFGYTNISIGAIGNATRRAVVVMLVLDRSGSMCMHNGTIHQPCNSTNTTYPCALMIQAAKQFTGQFAPGRDYIGMVTFSTDTYVASLPTTDFQSVLGYSNTSGSSSGAIDSITCAGGTNTAEGVSLGYQALYQTGLPGALNIIMLETDGLPNSYTANFYDSVNNVVALSNSSNCKDLSSPTKKTKSAGGFNTAAVIPSWTTGLQLNSAPFATTTGYYSNIPAGMIGVVYSDDPGGNNSFTYLFDYWSDNNRPPQNTQVGGSGSNPYNTNYFLSTNTNAVTGCSFDGGTSGDTTPNDFSWFPASDVFGNSATAASPYKTVTTDAQGHITQSGSNPANYNNFHSAALNITDNAAYVARANATIPAYVFAIGLGGNSTGGPPDPILLQRMANDPNGDLFNATPQYTPCAQETGCITYPSQDQGKFIYSPTSAELNSAFLALSSQILRLNQ